MSLLLDESENVFKCDNSSCNIKISGHSFWFQLMSITSDEQKNRNAYYFPSYKKIIVVYCSQQCKDIEDKYDQLKFE